MKISTFTMLGRALALAAAVAAAAVWTGGCVCASSDHTYEAVVSSAGTGASGGGSYEAGATVAIYAGAPPAEQRFKNWTTASGGVIFARADSARTTFTMPANDVTVTAVFEQEDAGGAEPYDYVELGGNRWMKKNMNIETTGSWCYKNSADYCAKYGRLYTWAAAKSVCESVGWRLPDTADWNRLIEAAGGDTAAGWALRSDSGWPAGRNGTDDFGFSAFPGGYRYQGNGDWLYGDVHGFWYSSTPVAGGSVYTTYARYIGYLGEQFVEAKAHPVDAFSVRCVTDSAP